MKADEHEGPGPVGDGVFFSFKKHEGLADFHAASRHSQITGLIASGASILEAKELVRHADIWQKAKYTHIGMRAKDGALASLVVPQTCEPIVGNASGFGRRLASGGGAGCQRQGCRRNLRRRKNPFRGRDFVIWCR